MNLKHKYKANREAEVIAELGGIVLFNAIEKGKIFYPNMVRPSSKFWDTYA